jgi:hypothetical protein
LLDPTYGAVDTREVSLFANLAHASSEGVSQHRCVDAAAHEDHAKARTCDPHAGRQLKGTFEVNGRTNNHGVLTELRFKVPTKTVKRWQHERIRTERRAQRLGRPRVVLEDCGH